MTAFWTILIIGLIAIEASTTQLVCIWFAGGAFVALLLTLLGAGVWPQVISFVVISAILLIATKPLVAKIKNKTTLKTNTEALIGKKAIVLEEISNLNSKGTVKFHDVEWSARSRDDSDISAGSQVLVEEISGVKLIVSKIEEE